MRDIVIRSFGETVESLSVAKLYGHNMLYELAD
jgi:hypothetical protein